MKREKACPKGVSGAGGAGGAGTACCASTIPPVRSRETRKQKAYLKLIREILRKDFMAYTRFAAPGSKKTRRERGTRGRGDTETRGHGDTGTRGKGDRWTKGQG